ncbi:hypothetical protein HYZ99_04460, partial [Candidatus Peregrinibacteria bacterium]|nr:hypothetical protein [Candidatus Peregrinibacteria bacterium]
MNPTATAAAPVAPAFSESALRSLWLEILRKIEMKLQRSQFITWFKDTTALGFEDGTFIVGLPLPMYLNWHMEHYRTMTLECAREVEPGISQIVYKVDVGLKDNVDRTFDLLGCFPEGKRRKLPGKQEVKLAEGIITKILSPRYTLENFVVGSDNR